MAHDFATREPDDEELKEREERARHTSKLLKEKEAERLREAKRKLEGDKQFDLPFENNAEQPKLPNVFPSEKMR